MLAATTAPSAIMLTPVGGNVIANTLNATNTNLQIQATITAGEATGGTAEFYIGTTKIGTDAAIAATDTTVTVDTSDGSPTSAELQALVTSGGAVSVKLIDTSSGSVTSTANPMLKVDYTPPTVTAANISLSGASGTGGAFKIGDTVTATWNNTGTGDNNTDTINSVTVDFSQFGGGAAVAATNSSGTWAASFTIAPGNINAANRNVSVTATDNAGNPTTTAGTNNATVNNQGAFTSINGGAMPAFNSRATPISSIGFTLGTAVLPQFTDIELFYSPASTGASAVIALPGTLLPAPALEGSSTSWVIKNLSARVLQFTPPSGPRFPGYGGVSGAPKRRVAVTKHTCGRSVVSAPRAYRRTTAPASSRTTRDQQAASVDDPRGRTR